MLLQLLFVLAAIIVGARLGGIGLGDHHRKTESGICRGAEKYS